MENYWSYLCDDGIHIKWAINLKNKQIDFIKAEKDIKSMDDIANEKEFSNEKNMIKDKEHYFFYKKASLNKLRAYSLI